MLEGNQVFLHSYIRQFHKPDLLVKLTIMLHWVLAFLIIALIAALFGFTGIAIGAAAIAKILFYIFLVLFVLSLLVGAIRGFR